MISGQDLHQRVYVDWHGLGPSGAVTQTVNIHEVKAGFARLVDAAANVTIPG
jgi:hypothetical protein